MGVESSGNIFANARKTMCFFKIGMFEDGLSGTKMVKAPFDLVLIPSAPNANVVQYVEPTGFDVTGVYNAPDQGYELMQARTGAWLTGDNFVLDQHQMGDLTDSWLGLNYFSHI